MLANTLSCAVTHAIQIDDNAIWSRSRAVSRRLKSPKLPHDADIDAWLKHNAPVTFQELADIRYVLYHRCSRTDFIVSKKVDDQFTITGRHSELRIISHSARHYLLWKLRLLGREKGWIGALPRTKSSKLGA